MRIEKRNMFNLFKAQFAKKINFTSEVQQVSIKLTKKEFLNDVEKLFLPGLELENNKVEALRIKGFPDHAAIINPKTSCALVLTSSETLTTQDGIITDTLPYIPNSFLIEYDPNASKNFIADKKIQFCCFTLLNADAQKKVLKMGSFAVKRGLAHKNDIKDVWERHYKMFVLKTAKDFIENGHVLIPLQGGVDKTKTIKFEENNENMPKIIKQANDIAMLVKQNPDTIENDLALIEEIYWSYCGNEEEIITFTLTKKL